MTNLSMLSNPNSNNTNNSLLHGGMNGGITFDEFNKLRILNPTHFENSEKLKDETKKFSSSINEFSSLVSYFHSLISDRAKQVEHEKLKTIGLRLQVEREVDNRKSSINRLQFHLNQRQMELDRLMVYTDSLEKVKREQIVFLDSLHSK